VIPAAVADEFAVRYYRWALADARREVEQDCPQSLARVGEHFLRAAPALVDGLGP
jgi:hypothetical protein